MSTVFRLRCLHRITQSDLSGREANAFVGKTGLAHHFHLLHRVINDGDDLIFPSKQCPFHLNQR